MENKEYNLSDIISTRVLESIKKLDAKENPRVCIKHFDEIKIQSVGNLHVFSHPIYSKKDLDYLNQEGEADVLLLENNGVYVNYDEDLFNFHKIEQEEKLVHVDLDNQEIIDQSYMDENSQGETGVDDLSEEITKKNDLITLNYFPISLTHSNLTISFDQNFPQVLSDEFIIQVIQIFSIAQNKSLRCGYNSLGAGCIINHLHFEIIFLDDFKKQGISIHNLPIEESPKTQIYSTKFINKNPEEISLFDENVEVTLSMVQYPLLAWKVEAKEKDSSNEGGFVNSIANCVNFILSELISTEIPHNLLISDGGKTIFIIPRKFLQSSLPINTCWNDLCGFITLKEEPEETTPLTQEKLVELINSISLTYNEFRSLTHKIVDKFDSLYILDKVEFDLESMKIE